jgi:hypothetical protein
MSAFGATPIEPCHKVPSRPVILSTGELFKLWLTAITISEDHVPAVWKQGGGKGVN